MIRNQLSYSKKDYLYIAKMDRWKTNNLVFYLGECVFGIIIISMVFPVLRAMILYRVWFDLKNTLFTIIGLLAGTACLCTPLIHPHIIAARAYKNYDKDSMQEIVFQEDDIIANFFREGVSAEQHFDWSLMDKYTEKNGAVYIRIRVDRSRLYLIARDDGYLEGSKGELIALLEENGVGRF